MTPTPQAAAKPEAVASKSLRTVLICDDDQSLAGIMKHLLSRRGFSVTLASDGEEALSVIRDLRPRLLLLDIAMPRRDGLDVLRSLKQGGGERPYVVVISGQENKAVRDEAAALGAREVWKKPFNAADLLSRIDALAAEGLI